MMMASNFRVQCAAVAFAICGVSSTAHSQIRVWEPGQKSFANADATTAEKNSAAAAQPEDPAVRVVRVTPSAEPIPALKYRFWVAPVLRATGEVNAAMSRAVLMHVSHPRRAELDAREHKNSMNKVNWYEGDLSQLAGLGLSEHLQEQREVLDQVYYATTLATIQSMTEATNRLQQPAANSLPEIQFYRNFARLISLDVRLALSERRFDDAVQKLAAGFRLAEYTHASGDSNLVSRLVAIAITGMMFGVVEEFIEQPGSPNLYWALASLPDTFFERASVVDGELASTARQLYPLLEPVPSHPSDDEMSQRLLVTTRKFVGSDGQLFDGGRNVTEPSALEGIDAAAGLIAGAVVLLTADAARDEALGFGVEPASVAGMTNAQAVVVAIQLGFERNRDNAFKWLLVPGDLKDQVSAEIEPLLSSSEYFKPSNILIGMLLPALQATGAAVNRIDSQHKQLLLREALRGHAATHDGQLPASFDRLSPLPAWSNPATSAPFDYERLSDTEAIIRREPLYAGEKQTNLRIQMVR